MIYKVGAQMLFINFYYGPPFGPKMSSDKHIVKVRPALSYLVVG